MSRGTPRDEPGEPGKRLGRIAGRVDEVEAALAVVRVDLECIAGQLRAIEHRLASPSGEPAPGPAYGSPSSEAVRDAAAILGEVRREHEQVRVRFQVISRYEERLRRLEDAVVKLYGGDLRGPGRS